MNRRYFIKSGSIALASLGVMATAPSFLKRALAESVSMPGRRKTLIAIFQRGAVDGLNVVVPFGEHSYYDLRPSIAVPKPDGGADAAINLDGFFGLHPALASFKPLWDSKRLAIVHAAGSPDNTRSHFDAQDYMETATPGVKSTRDGWLNRYLQATGSETSPLRGVAVVKQMPRSLQGHAPTLAVGNVESFDVRGGMGTSRALETAFAESSDSLLSG